MRSILLIVASLAASTLAAPASAVLSDAYKYSDKLAEYYARVSRHTRTASLSPTCDTSNIELPAFASGLPAPKGQKLLYAAVGRGTQNYTCKSSSADVAPVAIGAVASLYNATCIAANYPDLMALLPNVVYNISLPSNPSVPLPPGNVRLLGHHFFSDSTTPVFNLDTTPAQQYGIAFTKKLGAIDAPPNAFKGQNGAVSWLYLTTTNGTVGDYRSVYRVNTAGGQPPKSCEKMPAVFTMQYAANYYFYGV